MNILRKPFRYSFFNATIILIILNVAAHLLFSTFGLNKNSFGLNVFGFVYYHYFWQIFTYMFVHGDMSHLFFNMLALLIFGITIERTLGSKEFLLMYFAIDLDILQFLPFFLLYFLSVIQQRFLFYTIRHLSYMLLIQKYFLLLQH